MKLEEMAEILDGLANLLEKFLGKTAVGDFHAVEISNESIVIFHP